MVKTVTLTEINSIKDQLVSTVAKKIATGKVSTLNSSISKFTKVDLTVVKNIIDSIECRIRAAEIIYYTYLETPDHSLLSGIPTIQSLPFQVNIEYSFDTNIHKNSIEINDISFYKEIFDMNFRNFILLHASLFENIVALCEILIKKVYLHLPQKAPVSRPLSDYKDFLKTLVALGYRKHDRLYNCLMSKITFLDIYLPAINYLRNKFIHGYSLNTQSDGSNYKVILDSNSSIGSPDLDVDVFSRTVLTESISFIKALIPELTNTIKHHSRVIPA